MTADIAGERGSSYGAGSASIYGSLPSAVGWVGRGSGYNYRALVEADISRYKRVIGGTLRSRTDARRATEVAIGARALNRMLKLGRPEYVRIV